MSELPIYDRLRACASISAGRPTNEIVAEAADMIEALTDALQQFVNGVETHMIDSPADDILANVMRRAKSAIAKARGQ